MHSNTPHTMYATADQHSGGEPVQIAVYRGKDGRQKIKDIDWGHPHKNASDGREWKKGEIHVQEYNGTARSPKARKPSAKEKRLAMMVKHGRNG